MNNRILTPFLLAAFLSLNAAADDRYPAGVTVITREEISGRNFTTAGDILETLTDLNVERSGSRGSYTTVKMRGASRSDQAAVLLDGRSLNFHFDGSVDLSQIPASIIERIEINRNGSSLAYGAEGTSGSVNIITSRPSTKGLETELASLAGRHGHKRSHGRLFGRSNWGDLTYIPQIEKSGGFQENEQLSAASHFGNISRSFNGKGFWALEYFYGSSKTGMPKGTTIPFDQWNGHLEKEPVDKRARREQDSQFGKASLFSPKLNGGVLSGDFTYSFRDSDDMIDPNLFSTRARKSRESRFNLRWQKRGFETGAEVRTEKWSLHPIGSRHTFRNGVYVLNKFSGEKWTALPGVRFDSSSRTGAMWAPRLVFLFTPDNPFSLSSTVSRAYRQPTYDELYVSSFSASNANLSEEKSWTADLGFKLKGEKAEVYATGFAARIDDLIHPDASNRLTNGGREEHRGFETGFKIRSGESTKYRNVVLRGNYTRQKSKRRVPESGDQFVPSRLSPDHMALVRLDQHLPRKFILSNELRYKSEQFEFDNKTGTRIPSHALWNIRLFTTFLKADVFFAAENVANRRYADALGTTFTPAGGVPATVLSPRPGRMFWTGFVIHFSN